MTLQKANKAIHIRRKRARKPLASAIAMSVSEVQDLGGYKEVEAEIIEEMPRLKKRPSLCSKCGQQGHTCRTCRN